MTLHCEYIPRWPPYVQGQTINCYHFLQDSSRFVILVSTIGFSGTPGIVLWPERTVGHCIVGKILDDRHIFKVKQ